MTGAPPPLAPSSVFSHSPPTASVTSDADFAPPPTTSKASTKPTLTSSKSSSKTLESSAADSSPTSSHPLPSTHSHGPSPTPSHGPSPAPPPASSPDHWPISAPNFPAPSTHNAVVTQPSHSSPLPKPSNVQTSQAAAVPLANPQLKPPTLPSSDISTQSSSTPAGTGVGFGSIQNTTQASVPPTAVRSTIANWKENSLVASPQPATHLPTITSAVNVYPVSSAASTSAVRLDTTQPSFFANRSAVIGVFVVVALIALGILVFLITLIRRCRRDTDSDDAEPTPLDLHTNTLEGEQRPHYRRMSQVIASGNVFSPGAAGVGAGAVQRSRSFAGSDRTYHSTDPMVLPENNPFSNHHAIPSTVLELPDMLPYPQPTHPPRNASRHSVQSAADTTPSIYPPTLPPNNEDDYWRRQVPTPDPSQDTEVALVRPQPAQPYSSLGLWMDHPQTEMTPQKGPEGEITKRLDPGIGGLHEGSNAPIILSHSQGDDPRIRHVLDSSG